MYNHTDLNTCIIHTNINVQWTGGYPSIVITTTYTIYEVVALCVHTHGLHTHCTVNFNSLVAMLSVTVYDIVVRYYTHNGTVSNPITTEQ